jgi:hypothetical protein
MVSLGLPGASALGFRASYSVSFDKILPPVGLLGIAPPPIPIPTIVPVSSSFFEGDVKVEMDATGATNRFFLCIYGMGEDIFDLLEPQQTVVHITLGYDDGDSKEVMTGLLTKKNLEAGDQWYNAKLEGVDFVFSQLQRPLRNVAKNFANQTVGQIAAAICKSAGVDTQIPDSGPMLKTQTFNDTTPLNALNRLAQIAGFGLQAKDGKLWMGSADNLGGAPILLPITDGATSRPISVRGATASADSMDGQDFNFPGLPSLRPFDVAILGTKKFRIQQITHQLTVVGGYTCCGRALSPGASIADAQQAGRPSGALVAWQLKQNLNQRDRNRPAVDIGDVNTYTPGGHTTTLDLGHSSTPDMPSPTVQATLGDKPVPLNDKPIASPFAFDKCGLMVPVYPKMRSLLVHGWNEPEDAVVGGFVWTSDMTPPQNHAGDWWLCLPTQFGWDGKPTDKGVDDLISQDGKRVIQVKGLRITIGSGLLNSVGSRPTPGTDGSLTIESDDKKTKITFQQGQIQMTDGTVTLTVSGGMVSIAKTSPASG